MTKDGEGGEKPAKTEEDDEKKGEVKDEDKGAVIPASQRPDGTWRKEIRVKPGYDPAKEDDVAAPVVDGAKSKKAGKLAKKASGRTINFVSADDDDNDDSDEDDEDFACEDKSGSESDDDDDDDDDDSGSDSGDDDSDEDDDEWAGVEDPLASLSTSKSGDGFVAWAATAASNSMNEDRFFVETEKKLFGVFDGHGGSECSQYTIEHIGAAFAKQYTPKTDSKSKMDGLEGMFFEGGDKDKGSKDDKAKADKAAKKNDPTNQALKDTFQAVDLNFLEAHGQDHPTCGSCGLLCLLEEGCVWTANVGDSRAVLVRRKDKGGCEAVPLSVDQNTSNSAECAKVVARSRDRDAVRYNEAEARGNRKEAVRRVAGTLMVTRALGDGYLKDAAYSMPAFCASLPYITSKPKVTKTALEPRDECVVLGSDGVWEHLSNQEVAMEVLRSVDAQEQQGGEGAMNPADAVVDATIKAAAAKLSMQAEELRRLKAGNTRRAYVDDLTVIVIRLSGKKKRGRDENEGEDERRVKGKS